MKKNAYVCTAQRMYVIENIEEEIEVVEVGAATEYRLKRKLSYDMPLVTVAAIRLGADTFLMVADGPPTPVNP